jgi:hypothetical protein
VAIDKVAKRFRNVVTIDIATRPDFEGDIFRDGLRPMLKGVEGDDADRIVELPGDQIGDDRFEVRPLDVGLAIGGAKAAKAVDHEIDRLALRTIDGVQPFLGIRKLPQTQRNRDPNRDADRSFRELYLTPRLGFKDLVPREPS